MFFDIRAQEVRQELERIEQQRARNHARNEALLSQVREAVEQGQQSEGL